MHNNVGIMQGRLSSKQNQPLQSFPWNSWQKEFERANSIGFNQIEWLVDGDNDYDNPIASLEGQKEILRLSDKFDVSVKSLCAHSLIDGNLLHANPLNVESAKHKFSQILSWASAINVEFVIFPIMDAMSIQNNNAKEKIKSILHEVVNTTHPKVLLESNLPANQLKFFLDDVDLVNLGILYDLGNATAMGFDIENELKALHLDIGEVHIKDRYKNNGNSVRLGHADTQFNTAVKLLKDLAWEGSFVLETPILGDWRTEANRNFNFIANLIN
ncbi:sugar phosphate isomerase/epimerase [Candidatus Thioglobus sp.]|nr:sugar phosphate isomerase/epimerase [Candidatus Thioglobus sp.]